MQADMHVLWNSHSGSAEANAAVRERLLESPAVTLIETSSRDDAMRQARLAAERGASRVVAAGGDGTANAVVAGILQADAGAALAVLPLGTGNDLARSLGMPLDPLEAADVCLTGAIHRIDVVHAEGRREDNAFPIVSYANMATGGNTGKYLEILTDEMKRFWGPMCYLRGVIDVVKELDVYDIELQADDGSPQRHRALNVFIANGRTSGGGMSVAPQSQLDDGVLDYMIVLDSSPLELASLTADYLFFDRFLESDLIVHGRARRLSIVSDPPLPFTADGDSLPETPVEFEVLPGRLPVVTGPGDQLAIEEAGEVKGAVASRVP